MRAGRLADRVTLQSKSATRDAMGGEVITWADVATLWAEVSPLRGKEFFEAGQTQSQIDARITCRYRAGVVPTMRITHGSDIYDIQAVINPGSRNQVLELMCARGAKDTGL